MKVVFGILAALLAICGILAGGYVFLYQGWYLGIVGIVDAVQIKPVDGGDVALGVLRIALASFAGFFTAWFFWFLSIFCGSMAKGLR